MKIFFKTIAEFQAAGGKVNAGTQLTTITSAVNLADTTWLRPALGDTFLDALLDAYNAGGSLASWQTALLPYLQAVSANLAMPDLLEMLQIQISDAGVTTEASPTRRTAFQYQVNENKRSYTRKGLAALDRLLTYLESKIDDANFSAWAESDACKAAAELFINTASEFGREVDIRGSRATFNALVPVIRKVERFALRPVLGADFYDELKELVVDRELAEVGNAAEKKLIVEYIRPALAHLVKARALREHVATLVGDTVQLTPWAATPDSGRQAVTSAAGALEEKARLAEQDGMTYLAALVRYLNTTATEDVFPTYFASDLYPASADTAPTGTTAQDNSDAGAPTFLAL